jgi:hypothetical protein
MRTPEKIPVVPDNHSRTHGVRVERVPWRGRVTYKPAAIAFAVSTSGPGSGTKIVRR